jgi:hypothetical protein
LLAGFTIVLVIFIVLWVTAPQWEGPFQPHTPLPPQSFVSVNVTDWTFTGSTLCWQNAVFSNGGTIPLAGTFHAVLNLPYPGGVTGPKCTAQTPNVLTPGFALQNSNAPVSVAPGNDQLLYVNVTVPATAYGGPLSISLVVADA